MTHLLLLHVNRRGGGSREGVAPLGLQWQVFLHPTLTSITIDNSTVWPRLHGDKGGCGVEKFGCGLRI